MTGRKLSVHLDISDICVGKKSALNGRFVSDECHHRGRVSDFPVIGLIRRVRDLSVTVTGGQAGVEENANTEARRRTPTASHEYPAT